MEHQELLTALVLRTAEGRDLRIPSIALEVDYVVQERAVVTRLSRPL